MMMRFRFDRPASLQDKKAYRVVGFFLLRNLRCASSPICNLYRLPRTQPLCSAHDKSIARRKCPAHFDLVAGSAACGHTDLLSGVLRRHAHHVGLILSLHQRVARYGQCFVAAVFGQGNFDGAADQR